MTITKCRCCGDTFKPMNAGQIVCEPCQDFPLPDRSPPDAVMFLKQESATAQTPVAYVGERQED